MNDQRPRDDLDDDLANDLDDVTVVRREEELQAVAVEREAGRFRIRKVIDEQPFDDVITRGVEHADVERVPPLESDSGEVESLPDGSVSIPVFEEQLVVEKRLVVRERIIIRKRVVHESERIETQLRREIVEVDADPDIAGRLHLDERDEPTPDGPGLG